MKIAFWILSLTLSLQLVNYAHAGSDYHQEQIESDFEAWCAQGTRTLERARSQAAGQIAYGQFGSAAQTLINALKNGVARPNWSIKPVTWRLMNHATSLGEAMLMHFLQRQDSPIKLRDKKKENHLSSFFLSSPLSPLLSKSLTSSSSIGAVCAGIPLN